MSMNNVLMSFSRGVCAVYSEGMSIFGCHIMICAWQSGHHHSWFIYVSASIQWLLCLKIIWKLLCVTSSFLSRVWYGGFITPPALHQQWLSIVFLMNSKTMTGKGVIALRKRFFIVRVWITILGGFENSTGGDPQQLDWTLDLFCWEQGFGLHTSLVLPRCILQWLKTGGAAVDSGVLQTGFLGCLCLWEPSSYPPALVVHELHSQAEKLLDKLEDSLGSEYCTMLCSLSFWGTTRCWWSSFV